MTGELVIGLDSSTQSTKAIAWNAAGEDIATGKADIPMDNPRLDCFEQNPAHWWSACIDALKDCVTQLQRAGIDTSSIKGLAISNQRETLGFIGEDGEPSYPAIVWLDERSREQVKTFPEKFVLKEYIE